MANRPFPADELPAPPSAMITALHEDVSIIKEDMREIKAALIGTTLQPNGVIQRLAIVEVKADEHGKKLLVWGTILSVAGVAFVFLKDLVLAYKSSK